MTSSAAPPPLYEPFCHLFYQPPSSPSRVLSFLNGPILVADKKNTEAMQKLIRS